MPGPPNVNPFVHDYTEKLNPYISKSLDKLRPELEDLANIYISKLPWIRRGIVRVAWFPILQVVATRVADAVLETFLAWRGEVKVADCSGPTRFAFAVAPSTMKIFGDPHQITQAVVDPSAIEDDSARRREKMIRTIHRGREWFRADCKVGWLADPTDPRVKRFKCYEVAYTYYKSIPPNDRVGDPKIIDAVDEARPEAPTGFLLMPIDSTDSTVGPVSFRGNLSWGNDVR